jgi:hypothetical protein
LFSKDSRTNEAQISIIGTIDPSMDDQFLQTLATQNQPPPAHRTGDRTAGEREIKAKGRRKGKREKAEGKSSPSATFSLSVPCPFYSGFHLNEVQECEAQ